MKGITDTIAAIATGSAPGAIGTIRLSGPEAMAIASRLFRGKELTNAATHTLHFGTLTDLDGRLIDEVVVALFRGPKSYTGEDVVELTGHGSPYILQNILDACLDAGARLAGAGEFTQRAFLNGKMDLAQAEAVADLIAANTRAAQQAALQQIRGGFSHELNQLREALINFAALIELELDFGEEDVDFADRRQLGQLIAALKTATQRLLDSFRLGNVIKNGVSVAIIGKPNAGKSTLLNALLNEERAIVSDIAGTTRDTIEEALNIKGVLFRLIDTAGIRDHTEDLIEQIGVGRSREKMRQADVVLYLFDAQTEAVPELQRQIAELENEGINYLLVANKTDEPGFRKEKFQSIREPVLYISAKQKLQVAELTNRLYDCVIDEEIRAEDTVVTNARHRDALQKTATALEDIDKALASGISGDLLAVDIRQALYFLGSITGRVEVDRDILGTIFGKFCIGK